ncbi:MAG: hypothetical protein ACJ8DZ_04310 [Allosphingosinicella sp.]
MNKILFAATALGALAMAAPAAAQYGYQSNNYQNNAYQNNGYYNNGYANNGYAANGYASTNVDSRVARLDARIQAGIQAGTIDQREAYNLRRQLNEIARLDDRYSRNGYTASERADLQARLRNFRDQLAYADGGARGYGAYNSNRNGYYGQGGPYEEVACADTSRSTGLGGLIDSLFGGGDQYCTTTSLGVGARVTGNLAGVPYQYRNQYRDGYGYYYRSDGRSIYQIDTRTNTVLRVYPMN